MSRLLARDEIPVGCRWDGDRFIRPDIGLDLTDEEMEAIQYSAAYYELADALAEVAAAYDAKRVASDRFDMAESKVKHAAARTEYIEDLPSPPWVIGDHEVDRFWEGQGFSVSRVSHIITGREPTPASTH